MIPHAFLQDLLNRVDIVEVIGRFVALKKSGANFMGLCPFHNEKSPSFTVSLTKQFYHCFGCGAHGTAIGFLMEHTGLSFPEAVADLAQSVGMSVPHEAPLGAHSGMGSMGGASAAAGLFDVMQAACNYYRQQLRGTPEAIDYLKRRGLTGEVAARFGLGYAPPKWQNLEAVFANYHDNDSALVATGLVIDSDKSGAPGQARRYDRFRDRIMFPIRNARGQLIGFGGRVLDSGEPKYLNSPETPLFNKGSELYGLFEARMAIREKGYVLVVEGYMDVVALAQLGFPNAVATLGTSCTPLHVQKLFRQTDSVIFSFDGDAAGRRAARRALDACLPHATDDRRVHFLFLPAEHDPDSFVRERGAAAFEDEVQRALPLSQFLLNEIVTGKPLQQPEGRAKALFDAKPLLQAMPANALRVQILHRLAERLDTPFNEVAALCEVGTRNLPVRAVLPKSERRRVTGNEQRALRNLVMFPRIAHLLDAEDEKTLFCATRNRELFEEVLMHARALGDSAQFTVLSELLRASNHAVLYEEIFREILVYDENVRDVMLHDPGADAKRHLEQERVAGEELQAAVARLRYDGWCGRLNRLSQQGRLTLDETAEFSDLSRRAAELKKRLAGEF